mgnify:CR=1 FL=1|jgi:DNA-binding MarR family transcriptional regulator
MDDNQSHQDLVKKTTESIWKTIPPIWHFMRSIIHNIAREEFGITPAQFQILRRIKQENKRTVSELSDSMMISRPGVSRAVDELVIAGLIKRSVDPSDRRIVYLSPSMEGEELIDKVHEKNYQVMQALFMDLHQDELEKLLAAVHVMDNILLSTNIIK